MANNPPPQRNTRSSNYVSTYSNNVQMRITPFDFVLTFGDVVNIEGNVLTVEENVRIVMSPEHAKVFSKLLAENVSQFEKQIGTIVSPPQPDASK
jgi:hypothetical protein